MRELETGIRATPGAPRRLDRIVVRGLDRAGLACLLTAGLLIAGCAQGPTPGPAGQTATLDPGDGSVAGTEPETLGRRSKARAERDMAALEAMGGVNGIGRDKARPAGDSARDSGENSGPGATPTGSAATPRPAIRWDTPDDASTATRATTGNGEAPPHALARDMPPPVQVRRLPAADIDSTSSDDLLAMSEISLLLVKLRQELYRESIDSDQPIRELLAIAAMALVDPDLKLPEGTERDLSESERELLDMLHHFFADLGRRLNDQNRADEAIASAVDTLQKALSKTPELVLPQTALCWRVGGFADFDAFDQNRFLAHAEQRVILYLAMDGFTSEINPRGQWVTEVSQQLEIYSDRDGIPVWSEPWQKAVDVVNEKRRDFFTTQLITLPLALSVGRYHLKIRVRDEHSGAEVEDSIAFEMVADPKLAAKVGK